jgi:hypothetical protein
MIVHGSCTPPVTSPAPAFIDPPATAAPTSMQERRRALPVAQALEQRESQVVLDQPVLDGAGSGNT